MNHANADIMGIRVLEAAIEAIGVLDECVGRVVGRFWSKAGPRWLQQTTVMPKKCVARIPGTNHLPYEGPYL